MSEKGQQHDPGPWELEEDGGIRAACGGCIGFVQPHGNVNTIARCGESFSSANGHLMAAAPDLLEACEAAIAKLDYLQNLWGGEGVTRTVADRLRAAVTKAKGGAA